MDIVIILEYLVYYESRSGISQMQINFRLFNKYLYDYRYNLLMMDFIKVYYSCNINEWFRKIISSDDEYYLLLKDILEKNIEVFNYLPYITIFNNDKLICKLFKYNTNPFKDLKKRYIEHFINKNSYSKLQFLRNKERIIKIYNEGDKSIKDYLPENFKYILD
jgi:hypothetical protein